MQELKVIYQKMQTTMQQELSKLKLKEESKN